MPANIRFSMYETRETVEFVNQFAATILRVPLLSKLNFGPIKEVTKRLKGGFGFIYAMYIAGKVSCTFLPRYIMTKIVSDSTQGMTAAFSNVRGPAKQMFNYIKDTKKKTYIQYYCGYIGATGNLGLTMFCMSINGKMSLSLTSDDNVADEKTNQRILSQTVMLILDEIKRIEGETTPKK